MSICIGTLVGILIALIENFSMKGEISPFMIIVLLFSATGAYGWVWKRRAWKAAVAGWIWLPGSHLFKYCMGIPDSLHPDTLNSILLLALFTLGVSAAGLTCGAMLRGRVKEDEA